MAYTLIKGHFVVDRNAEQAPQTNTQVSAWGSSQSSALSPIDWFQRRSRNGGAIEFRPTQPELLHRVRQRTAVTLSHRATVEIRLEGVEALETEFEGQHQEWQSAQQARQRLLTFLGFDVSAEQLQRAPRLRSLAPARLSSLSNTLAPPTSAVQERAGYVLVRNADQRGRVIAFAYAGNVALRDGSEHFLCPKDLQTSANYTLLNEGLAYATFYDSLPSDLRAHLAQVSGSARGYNRGHWPHATATPGRRTRITCAEDLQRLVLLPKLFRRLIEYFAEEHQGLAQFQSWLRRNSHRDDALILPSQEVGHLHNVFEVQDDHIRLVRNSEEFIILKAEQAHTAPARPTERGSIRIVAALLNPQDPDTDEKTVTLLNTTAVAVDLRPFMLRDKWGGSLPLQGQLAPGETQRIQLRHLAHAHDEGNCLSLYQGNRVVDQVEFTRTQAMRRGVSLAF